jgi:hypothetical protein
VNLSAQELPYGQDEFLVAGLTSEMGQLSNVPLVKESPIKVSSIWVLMICMLLTLFANGGTLIHSLNARTTLPYEFQETAKWDQQTSSSDELMGYT